MDSAIRLSLKGKGKTSPNPMVGALVVKNKRIIGRGYHEKAGGPHAEVVALDEAGARARGATLYVTLEPCAHFGRTPPCVDRIVASGIKHVVVGMIDPNPKNNGRGVALLRQRGIKVETGLFQERISGINEAFIKYITRRMPLVTVKVAQSLDGKIATRTGDSKWITSDRSRAYAHRIRQFYDAVMVGVNTVLRDDPRLDAWFSSRHPAKVIIDSQVSTPQNANIFSGRGQVIIATLSSPDGQATQNRQLLVDKAKILEVKEKGGQIDLRDLLKKLAQRFEITSVLIEGGGTLIGSLFDEGLVDKVLFFISPKIIGGKDAIGSVMGKGVSGVNRAIKVKGLSIRRFGEDILLEGRIS